MECVGVTATWASCTPATERVPDMTCDPLGAAGCPPPDSTLVKSLPPQLIASIALTQVTRGPRPTLFIMRCRYSPNRKRSRCFIASVLARADARSRVVVGIQRIRHAPEMPGNATPVREIRLAAASSASTLKYARVFLRIQKSKTLLGELDLNYGRIKWCNAVENSILAVGGSRLVYASARELGAMPPTATAVFSRPDQPASRRFRAAATTKARRACSPKVT